ncbi:uncharacterized protein BP5553_05791 [Venustampulla echinocandica]|uniref:Telomeric single stranded DNA binding POT1/Cdc13 domain-containing protein n=1 Tax=Venustampulla echinocandica TaxID=2656787 RepID=A0A370TLQ3_9HELO|nr:uncharacterized protein BP5553_05791 [Venustampulla echinocandica]RDL36439.1 hypothetical protein BP5553_05791 [Venustampulla echinocandica]
MTSPNPIASATTTGNISHMPIPIAELSPMLQEPTSRSIQAIVTLTWPYSSATGSVAFLLAEPDFRLRRTRGQVRVQFAGSSAKYVAESHIASGDEVVLCLDGVEWIHDTANVATPGRGIEYELKFTERLRLQFRTEGSEIVGSIDIDHPVPEAEPEPEREPLVEVIPIDPIPPSFTSPSPSNINGAPTRIDQEEVNDGIFSSPAFVKRARTSYGSLFELDPFAEDDGTVPGKGRKRTRLSSVWKYTSRSPTPEVEQPEDGNTVNILGETPVNEGPIMTDEGCQTFGLDDGDAAEALASFSRQSINVGGATYKESIIATPRLYEFAPIPGSIQISDQERNDGFEAEQEERISPQPRPEIFRSPHVSNEFVADIEQVGPGPAMPSEERRKGVQTIATGSLLLEDGYEDLYAASPRGHRDESNPDGFGSFHVPRDDISNLDPSISEPVDQFVPEVLHDDLRESAAHLQHAVSPGRTAGNSNEMREAELFHAAQAGERSHPDHGSSPASSPLHPTSQLYPDLDDLAQQNPVPTWGAPLAPVMYPDLQEARERIEDDSSRASRPIAMSRSQSAQSQVADLTESSNEEVEDECSEEDEYSKYTRSRAQMGFEGRSMNEEKYGASKEDVEAPVAADVRNHYLQQAATRAEEYSQGSQEEPDGYYEDEDEEAEDSGRYIGFPNGRAEDDEELESIEDDEDEEGEDSESYDDEMEDYETPHAASAPKVPVVIDLLSSDDEATEEPHEPGPPVVPPQQSRSPAPSETSDQSEESGLDEEMRDNQDFSSSDDEAAEDLSGSEEEIVSPQDFRSQARATDNVEEHGSHDGMQNSQNIASPDPLQTNTASAEESVTDGSIEQEQEQEPLDQAAEHEEVNSEMNIEVSGHSFILADKSSAIQEEGGDKEGQGLESESSYSLIEEKVKINDDEEEHMELGNIEDANRTKADNHSEEANEMPPKSPRGIPSEAKRSPSGISLDLDGANDGPDVRNALPMLVENDPSSLPSIPNMKATSPPYDDNLFRGDGIKLPFPDHTHMSEAIVSAETSFSTGLDTQNSVLVSQNTLITQFSSQADEPANDIETGETKPETGDIEPSSSIAVDQPELTSASDVRKPLTEELIREKSPVSNIEQTAAEVLEEATEDVARHETTRHMVSGDGIEENLNRELQDSTQADGEPQLETANPPVITLRRSHRRIKSRSAEPGGDELQSEVLETATITPRRSHRRITSTSSSVEPGGDELQHQVLDNTTITPRRSHRRIKSTASSVDATDIQPTNPARSGENNDTQADLPLPIVTDEPSTPKGHDASFELALSSLDSPSKGHALRKPPVADLKLRLSRALRTELGEFTALKVLRYHLNHKLDVLAIVTTTPPEPQRSKGGPRHYQITFNITDPSIGPNGVAEVQIFRPYKEALPVVQAGDGVLLRSLQVISVKNRGFGLRSEQSEASSWAVFKDGEEAEVRGPPVEYGMAEKNHIVDLKTWYGSLDAVAMAKLNRANADKGSSPGKTPKRTG